MTTMVPARRFGIMLFLLFLGALPDVTALLGQQKVSPSQQTQFPAPQSPSSQPQASQPSIASAPPNSHIITVNFDYDFTKVPGCSPKIVAKNCIKQFDFYDISGGRYKLFVIPAPVGATGVVKGITGQSPRRVFEPGPHIISVTAEGASGEQSEVTGAKTTIIIPAQSSALAHSPH
jgi:hypothetical protein